MTTDTVALRELLAMATPGQWRWEFNATHKSVQLCGGRPQFDKTVMDFTRWGMSGAQPRFMGHEDGFSILHRLSDRPDWVKPFPGRDHHASWCAGVDHPDMNLMVAAVNALPALLDELDAARARIAELEKDAGRYRWLRASGLVISWNAQVEYSPGYEHGDAELMDAAIDAAIARDGA